MIKLILLNFFLLFANPIASTAQDNVKIDSLKNLLNQADQEDSISLLLEIGLEYFNAEDYSTALNTYFACLKHAESFHHIKGTADAANSIGRIYYNTENFTEGLRYFQKAHDNYEILGDEQSLGGVYNNIALIYFEIDSVDLAIDFYEKALKIKEKLDDKLNIAAIYHNLGLVYINQGLFEKGIKSLMSSREIFKELDEDKFAANTTNNIGRAYYRSKHYVRSLSYLKEALGEAKKINSPFLIMDNFKYQADCYNKMDNYKQALWFSNKYHNMKDSLMNIDKEKELAEIQAKYENEIDIQENELLKKENEANAATIRLQYILGLGVFVISILTAVLAIIYYRGNRTKKKANDLLRQQKIEIEEKNEVLRKLNKEITEQHDEIKSQKKELEELNGIKDKLFSIISHEFRSPLNSLKGTLTLLKIGAISEAELNMISRELTDKINSTTIFLDNLLNWAKSQMHGIKARPTEIVLKELAEENIQMLNSTASKKKIRLVNNISPSCNIYADANMMNLIFKNLISNAIKFSMLGGVVELYCESNDKEHTIYVKDEGIGITKENLKMLFQVQTFTTRGTANERGTGLGLYITKHFIESNGGLIKVESEEGKGCTVSFTIPIKQ